MARITGSKNKLARRIGVDLGLKTNGAKLAKRLSVLPGMHGRKGVRKMSEYGIQLKEKQKVKWIYGVLEKQFRRYYDVAAHSPTTTGSELLKLLELRLDNVVYRLRLAPTRAAARQMIVHGHVSVNSKKLDKPSYQVKTGDVIALSPKSVKIPAVADLLADENPIVPSWLERKAHVGKVSDVPTRDDVDIEINENLIVEFYSR